MFISHHSKCRSETTYDESTLGQEIALQKYGIIHKFEKVDFFTVTSFMDDPYLAEKWCFSDFGILKTNIDTKFRYI
jgi:hypothetical protein